MARSCRLSCLPAGARRLVKRRAVKREAFPIGYILDFEPMTTRYAADSPFTDGFRPEPKLGTSPFDEFPLNHTADIGQFVRHVKRRPTCPVQIRTDCPTKPAMQTAASTLRREICRRTRELREARGLTQAQVAANLGIGEEAYRKYESRSPMPHVLLERFAILVGSEVSYIITGKNRSAPQR